MPANTLVERSSALFYGWTLVIVLLLLVSIGMGTTMYMYSLIAGAVGQEFGASRLALMAGSTGMLLGMGLLSPSIGRLLDRTSSRKLLVASSLVMGAGFLWVAMSSHVWMVIASYILFISIGAAALSLLTAATLLTRWFVRYRGLAIGIAALGTQFGGFFYPPIFAATMEAYDWRVAIGGMGVLIMLAGPLLTVLFVVDRPSLKGLTALGADSAPAASPVAEDAAPAPTLGWSRLVVDRNFWLIVFIAGAGMATNTALLANLALFAVDLGEPMVRGAFIVSLVALIGVFASPFLGWLCDAINLKIVVAIMTVCQGAACLLFMLAETYNMLLLGAAFMGVGGGGVFPIYASMVAQIYDTRVYGQVLGASTLANSVLAANAPVLAGWVHDLTGSYQPLLLGLAVFLLLMTACIPLLQVPSNPADKLGSPQRPV